MNLQPIATIISPFKEKFGIPRQAALIQNALGKIVFHPPFDHPEAFVGLEGFSHIWVQFVFHKHLTNTFKPSVRPPRLGGNTKRGVFATRSSFRPNGLGLSLVKLHEVVIEDNSASLLISCPDLLDGTPILDIKPYVDYSDRPENAVCGYANTKPEPQLRVEFSASAEQQIAHYPNPELCKDLKAFIEEIIGHDPRPAYQQNEDRLYGAKIFDFEIKWRVKRNNIAVIESVAEI